MHELVSGDGAQRPDRRRARRRSWPWLQSTRRPCVRVACMAAAESPHGHHAACCTSTRGHPGRGRCGLRGRRGAAHLRQRDRALRRSSGGVAARLSQNARTHVAINSRSGRGGGGRSRGLTPRGITRCSIGRVDRCSVLGASSFVQADDAGSRTATASPRRWAALGRRRHPARRRRRRYPGHYQIPARRRSAFDGEVDALISARRTP